VGSNSVSAILFKRSAGGQQYSFGSEEFAKYYLRRIYTLDRKPFAQYTRENPQDILDIRPFQAEKLKLTGSAAHISFSSA